MCASKHRLLTTIGNTTTSLRPSLTKPPTYTRSRWMNYRRCSQNRPMGHPLSSGPTRMKPPPATSHITAGLPYRG
ncbi:unnamed protein product [Lasius platythorax]|uniref:Uncharacterized protein n=1 Tax=Lasius platythorax TaxID=488582 RepID=A0AAV2N025_9HYME